MFKNNLKVLWYSFVTTAIITLPIHTDGYQEHCPKMCMCDTYEDLNRANCSGQKLINAYIEMPKIVEILDLSNNDITTLDNTCFSEFKQLIVLSLANNSIDTIELDAFAKLRKLEHLTLSNNRIESFDRRIIEMAHSLISIQLDGNKFMNLPSESLLKSHSLKNLNLHNTHLTHVTPALLQNVPQLESLDLSTNLLITVNKDAFKHNKKLKDLNLNDNPWNCDANLEATLKWLKKRHINVSIKECPMPKPKPMFERMQLDPGLTASTTTKEPTTVNIDSVWRTNKSVFIQLFDPLVCPLNNSDQACDLYEACMLNYSIFVHQLEHKFTRLETNPGKQPNRLKDLEFVIGMFVGILLGATAMYALSIVAKCCQSSLKRRRARRRRLTADNRANYTDIPTVATIRETPVRQNDDHITRHRRRAPLPPIQPRDPSPTFLASLFQRRRRYTTNLVRRLSQSRLFLARQNSAAAANGDTVVGRYRELDTQRLIDTGSESSRLNSMFSITGQRLAMATAPSETQLTTEVFADPQDDTQSDCEERSETPPPAYKDIVSKESV